MDLLTNHFPAAIFLKRKKVLDIFFPLLKKGRQRERELQVWVGKEKEKVGVVFPGEKKITKSKASTFLMALEVVLPNIRKLLFDFLSCVTGK